MARVREPAVTLDIPSDPYQFYEAIASFRRRVPMTDKEWDTLTAEERQFAFKVADVAQADVITEVWQALDDAIANGTTFEAFKEAVGQTLTESWGVEDPSRLETIFRTNVQQAYSDGRYEQLTNPAVLEARPFWEFVVVEDERTTEICSDAAGTVLPADDEWWQTHKPPLHFNCRSTFIALTDEEAEERGLTSKEELKGDEQPQEGFGLAPQKAGEWEPDVSKYPDAIKTILEQRLET